MSQKVSDRDFVVCWVTSECLEDVVKGTGLTKAGCQYRARQLRKRGVRLMVLKSCDPRQDDVGELNKLVEKYSKRDKNKNIRIY